MNFSKLVAQLLVISSVVSIVGCGGGYQEAAILDRSARKCCCCASGEGVACQVKRPAGQGKVIDGCRCGELAGTASCYHGHVVGGACSLRKSWSA